MLIVHELGLGNGFSNMKPKAQLTKRERNWLSYKLKTSGEFPSGPVIRTPCFHYQGHGFNP